MTEEGKEDGLLSRTDSGTKRCKYYISGAKHSFTEDTNRDKQRFRRPSSSDLCQPVSCVMAVVIITGASRFSLCTRCMYYILLIFGLHRGIGLAATSILLKTFKATVVAISRTRSSELDALATAHPGALQIIQCNMPVSFRHSLPSLSLITCTEPMSLHSQQLSNPCQRSMVT